MNDRLKRARKSLKPQGSFNSEYGYYSVSLPSVTNIYIQDTGPSAHQSPNRQEAEMISIENIPPRLEAAKWQYRATTVTYSKSQRAPPTTYF